MFDSDGGRPLSPTRIVSACMVWPYCSSRPPVPCWGAASHCSCLSRWIWNTNVTLDVSRIEWNTNNSQVTFCNYCRPSGPPGGAAKLGTCLVHPLRGNAVRHSELVDQGTWFSGIVCTVPDIKKEGFRLKTTLYEFLEKCGDLVRRKSFWGH
jgi:hypothetical protein